MKKLIASISALVLLCGVCAGCSSSENLGSKAPEIAIDRGEYIKQKNASLEVKDISCVTDFLDTLNAIVGEELLQDVEVSYDPKLQTVYATTKDANIAFRLDDNGEVMMASANGSPEIKAALNRGIAKAYIGSGKAGSVDSLWNKIDEIRWLNDINSAVVVKAAQEFRMDELDITLPSASLPESYLKAPDTTLKIPSLTDCLESKGIKDLTNYYESPSLSKFWKDSDMSDIEKEISDINKKGTAIKDSYANISLEKPNQKLPNWNLDSYTLPSKFADGSSTDLGKETADAFESFQSSLSGWRDELWQKELDAQKQGNDSIQQANAQGNQKVQNGLSNANTSVGSIQSQNKSTVESKDENASSGADAFQKNTEDAVQSAITSGKQESQKKFEQDLTDANDKFDEFLQTQK